jgi:hypothetical protein
MAIAAEVEHLIPVGAITREPGDIVGEDDPDLVERNASYKLLESLPTLGGARSSTEIGIDNLDRVRSPAALKSPLLEGLLKVAALLVGQSLMRTGLTNVDESLAAQVEGSNEFGNAHRLPPCRLP